MSFTSTRRTNAAPKVTLETQSRREMPLVKINFILMAIAGAMIVIGFLLMTGSSTSTETFDPDIFSTRRIVIGPTIAFLGFLFMGFGIMWKAPKSKSDNDTEI